MIVSIIFGLILWKEQKMNKKAIARNLARKMVDSDAMRVARKMGTFARFAYASARYVGSYRLSLITK